MLTMLRVACDSQYRRFYAIMRQDMTLRLYRGQLHDMSTVELMQTERLQAGGYRLWIVNPSGAISQLCLPSSDSDQRLLPVYRRGFSQEPLRPLDLQDVNYCLTTSGRLRLKPRPVCLSTSGFMRLFQVMRNFLLVAYPADQVEDQAEACLAAIGKMVSAVHCLVEPGPSDPAGINIARMYLTTALRSGQLALCAQPEDWLDHGLRLHEALLDVVTAVLDSQPSLSLLPVMPRAGYGVVDN